MTLAAYFRFQARTVSGPSTALGIEEGWAAPIGVFDAPKGLDEETWVDSMPITAIAVRLAGGTVTRRDGICDGRTTRSSAVALKPKGTPSHFLASGRVRFAHIYLSDGLIDRVADAIRPGSTASGALRDDLVFKPDPRLDTLARTYVDMTVSGVSPLELEGSAILLIGYVLRAHHGFDPAKRARGGLAPWQLKRACEAMDAHLDGEFGLDMLADIVGCSPTHFSRAFKLSTGVPPSAWLLQRRMARAKALLEQADTPLAEVALAVGFAAQPQFTTAFKREMGKTPGAWRRERRR